MKSLVSLLLLMTTFQSFADTQSKCHFNGDEGIELVRIVSKSDYGTPYKHKGFIEITHVDGSVEKLSPRPFVEGTFNQVNYTDTIPSFDGFMKTHKFYYAYVSSRLLGDVKIAYACAGRNRRDCSIRGADYIGTLAAFSINGDLYRFNYTNNNLCSLEDL